jgi:hypothetical protein
MHMCMERRGIAMLGVLVAVASLLPGSPASAGRGCPEIKGSSDPEDPSHVLGLFWDVYGCQVPLRAGVGHIPWEPGDFGYRHIASRHTEGATNHELTAFALGLWANAMVKAGSTKDIDFICYQTHYTSRAGAKRTMRVYVDYKMLGGYTYKGIVTAYWVRGHKTRC